jgi:hypothetical protein
MYVYIDIYTLKLCIIDLTQRECHTLRFSRKNLLREVKRDGLNDDMGTVSRRLSLRFKGNPTILCRAGRQLREPSIRSVCVGLRPPECRLWCWFGDD